MGNTIIFRDLQNESYAYGHTECFYMGEYFGEWGSLLFFTLKFKLSGKDYIEF